VVLALVRSAHGSGTQWGGQLALPLTPWSTVSDEVIPDHVRRTLVYLALLNANGYQPTVRELDAFAVGDQPIRVTGRAFFNFEMTRTTLLMVSGYMQRLGWISVHEEDKVQLTPLGFALAKAVGPAGANAFTSGPATAVLDMAAAVLSPDDPETFERFTRAVAGAGDAMLADPYFKGSTIGWVQTSTTISRVLMSEKGAGKGEEGIIAARLAAGDVAGRIEVRISAAPEFHDRAVVGQQGEVWVLGTSLNGVGKHLSVLTRPDRECWPIYRKRLEDLWRDARVIAPQPIVTPTVSDGPGSAVASTP
jgi:hypothetical protein